MKKKLLTIVLLMSCAVCSFSQNVGQTSVEQRIFDKFQPEIEAHARFLYEDEFVRLTKKYVVPDNKKEQMGRYCREKELRKYICNYKSYDSLVCRFAEKEQIDSVYMDSIFALLVPYNPQMTGRAISLALYFADLLSLTSGDVSILTENAVDYARRLSRNPCASFAGEEMTVLKNVLSYNQLRDLLEEKNSKEAAARAAFAWKSLQSAKMTNDLDSLKDGQRAYLYYRTELCARDYYVSEEETLNNNLKDLYSHRPRIIIMYESLERRKQVQRKHADKVGDEYAW